MTIPRKDDLGSPGGEGARASELLGDVLSPHARRILDELDLRRDASLTCPPGALRRSLEERGLPVYESALELEERAGGLLLARMTRLATFAALLRYPDLRASDLLVFEGRPLLPIDASEIPSLWIDEAGVIYAGDRGEGSGDPAEGFCAPIYASYVKMFERFALQREPHWSPEPRLLRGQSHHLEIWGKAGEAVAEALEIPFFPAASDPFVRVWFDEPSLVQEINIPEYRVATIAYLTSPEAAATAEAAARRAWPGIIVLRDGKRL